MALALYRKYRPATFAEVVGQEHVTEPLRVALAAGRINHAYLFSGPRGCGKTSSARILARSLNCVEGPTPDPCGVCPSCVALAPEGPGSLDVVELDAASHGGVEDTRDLRDRAFYMPAQSRYRVFIIDEAHMVTTQGFNALLKIVEEPPEHLVFIFATTEPDKVLPTIRSRTHHYPFRLIPPATLRTLLERLCADEGVRVEPAVFPLVIQAGGGSARDSLSVLDQLLAGAGEEGVTYRSAVALLGVTDAALLDEMVDALAAADGASVFGAVDRVVEAGHDPRRFASDLLGRLRDLIIMVAVPEASAKGLIDAPADQLASMAAQADRLGAASLSRFAEVLHTGLVEMRGTTSPRLVLELMCARMLLPAASLADGALLQRLERVERRMAIAGEDTTQPQPAPSVETRSYTRPSEKPPAADPAGRTQASRSTASRRPSSAPAAEVAPGGPAVSDPGSSLPRVESSPATPKAEAVVAESASIDRSTGVVAPVVTRTDAPVPGKPAPDKSGPAVADSDVVPQSASSSTGPAGDTAWVRADSIGVTDVRREWAEILSAVKRRRRTTQIMLDSATVSSIADGALFLTMSNPGLARRVLEPDNANTLRAALREILGVDWIIRCDAGADLSPPGAAGSANSAVAPDEDDIPDEYGDEPDVSAPSGPRRDPEEVAIELLTAQLGAKRLES